MASSLAGDEHRWKQDWALAWFICTFHTEGSGIRMNTTLHGHWRDSLPLIFMSIYYDICLQQLKFQNPLTRTIPLPVVNFELLNQHMRHPINLQVHLFFKKTLRSLGVQCFYQGFSHISFYRLSVLCNAKNIIKCVFFSLPTYWTFPPWLC